MPFAPPAHVVSFGRFELRFNPERMPFTGSRACLAGRFEIDDSAGSLAVEHGRIMLRDGTVVAESMQTRLTAGR